jgi:hypothetical protein
VACVFVTAFLCAVLHAEQPIVFEDVTEKSGLAKLLKGWQLGHGAAWGDADGDGRPDLYVGAFADRPMYKAAGAPIPNMLLLNKADGFALCDDKEVRLEGMHARTTCAIFVDLDNDGDLDLFVANHAAASDRCQSVLFENLGKGRFRDVTPKDANWPRPFAMRNCAAIDVNADGLLDLVFLDGGYSNWRSGGGRLVVMENKGGWRFEDVSARLGLPRDGTAGMGLAIGDVNDDGVMDLFVADCNRLFVSGPDGKYRECQPGTFVKPAPRNRESHACGAAFGDLNGDGLLDLVTTEHGQPARMHVYVNKGVKDGLPEFAEVTKAAGLDREFPSRGSTGLAVKTAHVALFDADNDGRNDIYLSVIWKDANDRVQPLCLRNLGAEAGVPRFAPPPMERLVTYYAPGPVADYDRDGRVDVFLPTWFAEVPSYLFRNATEGGRWLTVKVAGKGKGFNAMGIGATVRAYKPGAAADAKSLLARRDVVVGTGYSSGEEALAHLGLGGAAECDVEVTWGNHKQVKPKVATNQIVVVTFGED